MIYIQIKVRRIYKLYINTQSKTGKRIKYEFILKEKFKNLSIKKTSSGANHFFFILFFLLAYVIKQKSL